jgi:hypothetical protein
LIKNDKYIELGDIHMYIVTGKITRQSLEDSFHTIADPIVSDAIRLYWVQEYKETGKCININVVVSTNQLELQTTQIWENQQSYLDYKNDATLISGLFSIRDAYWAERGITGVIVSEETI